MLKFILQTLVFVLVHFIVLCAGANPSPQLNDTSRVQISARKYISDSKFDSAIYVLQQGLNEMKLAHNWESYLDYLIFTASIHQSTGNRDIVIYLCKHADSIINNKDLNFPSQEQWILYLKGLYFYDLKNIDSARYFTKRASMYSQESIDDSLSVILFKLMGNIELYEKKYDEALSFYYKSLNIEKKREHPSQATFASLNQNIGITLFYRNEYDSARFFLGESLKIKELILGKNDPKIASGNLNFGLFLLYMGETYESLQYLNRAEELYINIYGHDYYGLAPVYNNKGSLLATLNNYEEALNYQLLAFELYKNNLENDNRLFYSLHWNLGSLYSSLNRNEEAIEHLLISLQNKNDEVLLIQVSRILAKCYQNLGQFELAETYYLSAIRIAENLSADFSHEKAYSYVPYAKYNDDIKNFDKALLYYLKAYDILDLTFSSKSRHVLELINDISNHYFLAKDYKNSLIYSQKALIAQVDDFIDTNLYVNPSTISFKGNIDHYKSLNLKARAFYGLYFYMSNDIIDLKSAFETAELGISVFEQIKSSMGMDKTKLRLTEEASDLYDLAVIASSRIYELTGDQAYLLKSFEYSEKSKASVLLSTVRQLEALEIATIPVEVRASENKIKNQITQYENVINDENQKTEVDSIKLARARRNLFKKRIEYDSLVAELENSYPDYYNLKYSFKVITPFDIQKRLNNDEILIEYKLIDSLLFVYLITEDSIKLLKNNIGNNFSDKVESFVGKMNVLPEMSNLKENSHEFANLGYDIYKTLLLDNSWVVISKNLIIVPDGILGYLSFDALLFEKPQADFTGYRTLSYLIRKHAISYGYSATLLFKDYEKRSDRKRLLAMAPSYESLTKVNIPGMSNLRDLSKYLYPLKHSQKEVEQIHKTFKGEVFEGKFATESNFKANSEKFSLLHFAMHTLINDEDPLNSKLVFSLEGDTIDDGFLNTYEIYNLKLNAELAVLSACKTGVGKISKGEGIMSLARGFLYAGVPGIVMTLWAIEDISTAEIITSFYDFLKRGERKDVSLQKAKLLYLENANQLQSHPYFWAAYVQIGDQSALSDNKRTYYYFFGGIVLIIVVTFFIFRGLRKS